MNAQNLINMNLSFNISLADTYHSSSQKVRVMTEDWFSHNMYCPVCGTAQLSHFEANRPVADFYCAKCGAEYELKSMSRVKDGVGDKIVDGAYDTMISRINAFNNPHFFFLTYYNYEVRNLIFIPNHFFVPEIIEKRKPLSDNARRAGWIGCNINLTLIPEYGKIFVVHNSNVIDSRKIIEMYSRVEGLKTESLESRGWLVDIMQCLDKLENEFTLNDVYAFTNYLQLKHPNNNNVQPKIRQQLQVLRDNGFLEFTSRGHYKKIGRYM